MENAGGVWKGSGLLKTVIVQFEYEIEDKSASAYAGDRSESEIQYTLDMCKDSMADYAERHGYDFKYITETTDFHEEQWKDYDPRGKIHFESGGKTTKLGDDLFCGTGWKYVYGWFYYLPKLALEYDRIIKTDTDVYVINPEIPFPIEKTGFVSKCLKNLGIIMFDKETANAYYEWGIKNLIHEEGYWALMHNFLEKYPQYANLTLPIEFHNTIARDPQPETCVMYHLSSMPNNKKYKGLCTALEKYT